MMVFLFSVAITVVFVRGTIFEPLRSHGPAWWRTLASCALCSGWWVGAGAKILILLRQDAPRTALDHADVAFVVVGAGALTAVLAYFVVVILEVGESSLPPEPRSLEDKERDRLDFEKKVEAFREKGRDS